MTLDAATLVTMTASVTGLLGVFLLALWLQERGVRALAWWGGAYLMGTAAVVLWRVPDAALAAPPELASALLFLACGMIWNGARLFHGRKVRRTGLLFGAAAWCVAMQFPGFVESEQARASLASAMIALYAFLTAFELRRERRRELATRWTWIAIPLLHGAVFLAPLAQILLLPGAVAARSLFPLFAFETMIYVVGTAFLVVVMAKERMVLIHKTAAMTDPLTGLFNRRAFLEGASRLIEQRGRKAQPVSLMMFDLDRFKSINDRFGHAVGDEALKLFAVTAAANVRATDVLGRLGGEEFAAIIPGGEPEAELVAERLRSAFQEAGVTIAGHPLGATVSIGVAAATGPVPLELLLARADAALYRAKHNGRNRIEFDGPAPEPLPSQPALAPAAAAVAPAQG